MGSLAMSLNMVCVIHKSGESPPAESRQPLKVNWHLETKNVNAEGWHSMIFS